MHRTLQYAILFIVMVILQIFLFSRIGISVYVHPLVCIAFIVLLPMESRTGACRTSTGSAPRSSSATHRR